MLLFVLFDKYLILKSNVFYYFILHVLINSLYLIDKKPQQ